MRLGKEFAAGAVVGMVAGVAGAIKVMWDSGHWHDIRLWAANKLIWKICGKNYYLRDRRYDNINIVRDEGADEIDEKAYAVMDVCGVKGLYCDKSGELEKRLMRDCDMYKSGIYGSEDWVGIDGQKYYLYYFRGGKGDDPGAICTVDKAQVTVNFCGVFVTDKKMDIFGNKNYYELKEDDWGFTGEWMTVSSFLSDEQWRQR